MKRSALTHPSMAIFITRDSRVFFSPALHSLTNPHLDPEATRSLYGTAATALIQFLAP